MYGNYIVDTHVHFYDPRRTGGIPWPKPDDKLLYRPMMPTAFQEIVDPLGITGCIAIESSPNFDDNLWLLETALANPIVAGVVANVSPTAPNFGDQLSRLSGYQLFRGIRIHGPDVSALAAGQAFHALEKLAIQSLPLDVLIDADQLPDVQRIARRIPDLKIVINHAAHPRIVDGRVDSVWRDRIAQMRDWPNVFCKYSGFVEGSVRDRQLDEVSRLLRATFGVDRLIYASNWPVCLRGGDYATAFQVAERFARLLDERSRAKFYWKNAFTVYEWIDRTKRLVTVLGFKGRIG